MVCATHRNLARLMNEELFRADLYYRLHVVDIRVPSLSERFLDIPPLIPALTAELKYEPREWADDAVAALMGARLRGNVRELRNKIERALIDAPPGGKITAAHLGLEAEELLDDEDLEDGPEASAEVAPEATEGDALPFPVMVDVSNKSMKDLQVEIFAALRAACGGNAARAGRLLGLGRSTMKRFRKRVEGR